MNEYTRNPSNKTPITGIRSEIGASNPLDCMSVVQLSEITVRYSKNTVLDKLSLSVEAGEYLVVLGESGCGKTSLLRVIAGLIRPSAGVVRIDANDVRDVPPRLRDVTLVPQHQGLYPHLTVRQSIALGCGSGKSKSKRSKSERERCVLTAAEFVGIESLLERRPDQLSGGQLKRAALAKALASDARVKLFDEPLSAVDAAMRFRIEKDLRRIHDENAGVTIHVTHDGSEALRLADRIAVIESGMIIQCDQAEQVYRFPKTVAVASTMGSSPFLMTRARWHDSVWVDESGGRIECPNKSGCEFATIGYYVDDGLSESAFNPSEPYWNDTQHGHIVPLSKLRWFFE